MDLDGAITFLALLLHWRVLLATLSAAVAAIGLAHVFPWFSALQGIALTCIACGAGMIWHTGATLPSGDRRSKDNPSAVEPTAASTFAVAAFLFGVFWGWRK
jgi:hypothetical protein